MMCRGGIADPDRAAQHQRHFDPAAAHILDLGGLVEQLANRVQDEIDEHKVDDRAGAGHRRASTQADKTTLADRCVAQPHGAVFLV
jgi:hypothetical protein